jgi:hypothetical protein
MSSRLAAGMAVLCTVFAGSAIAAERRPVAVVDLSNDKAGRDTAVDLGEALNNHAELKPIDDPSVIGDLFVMIPDEEAVKIAEARAELALAETAFEARDFPRAVTLANSGQSKLGFLAPTPAVVRQYAELAFMLAQALLGDRKPGEAAPMFRLVHQLNPEFQPNAARTFPEVIAAYEAAKKPVLETGTIAVPGEGTAFIDGKQAGIAPQWFPNIPAGLHVVWLTGPERDPRLTVVNVEANKKVEAKVDDAPTSTGTKIRRARLVLRQAPDSAARAAAMQRLATLLNVRDAVLINTVNQKLIVQTWSQKEGFAALREIKAKDTPADLLEPLAPKPKIIEKVGPPIFIRIPVAPKAWYEKKRYWGLATVALGVLVGSIVAYTSWDRRIGADPNPSFGGDLQTRPR